MEKKNVKEQLTSFWDKHKVKIIVAGGAICGGVVLGKVFNLGFTTGFKCGTVATLSWCDAQWPELELAKRWKEWLEQHPNEVKTI